MKMKLAEVVSYSDNAPSFTDGLVFVQSGVAKEDTVNFLMWLRRYCNKNHQLSVMFIVSTHESDKILCQKVIRTGKRGRPKKAVSGTETDPHIHMIVINHSSSDMISSVKNDITSYCQRRRKKRSNLKQQKMMPLSGMDIVQYMSRQADEEHTIGSFDFSYFTDVRYVDFR